MNTLRAALRLGAGAHPLAGAGLLLVMPVAAGPAIASAWCTKKLVEALSAGGGGAAAIRYALLGGGALALSAVVSQLTGYLSAAVQARIQIAASERLHDRINGYLGMRPFEDPAFRDRLMLAQQAAGEAPYALLSFAVSALQGLLTIVGFTGVLLTLWPPAGLLVLAVIVPEFIIQRALTRRAVRAAEDSSGLLRTQLLFQGLLTDLRAVREVRLYQLGAFFHGKLSQAMRRSRRIQLDAQRHAAVVHAAWALAHGAVAVAGTVGVIAAVAAGKLTVGDLMLFVAALAAVQSGLSAVVVQLGDAATALRLFGNYAAIMADGPDLVDGTLPAPPLCEAIVLRDVWFRYDPAGPWVLKGVNLTLPAGGATGVVGLNGAGKSTLVKLLCRFYDPQRGRITWDGVDLRDLRVDTLRARMGAVFQDFMCYDLTAYENIEVGRRGAGEEAVRHAARLAEVDTLLDGLPRGYRTLLSRSFFDDDGDTGVTLSGGQWQRVALARSLMRADADLLILDEPSSGLDVEAEARIHATLTAIRQGRSGLLISHRLSALRGADRIVVLDDGRAAECGSHDALMAAGGAYARLFRLQAEGYQLAAS